MLSTSKKKIIRRVVIGSFLLRGTEIIILIKLIIPLNKTGQLPEPPNFSNGLIKNRKTIMIVFILQYITANLIYLVKICIKY